MARDAYKSWDISAATTHVLGFAEQLANLYKKDYAMPMNTKADKDKAFAPSHLFRNMLDYYYSDATEGFESEYINEFFREDDKAPYRGYYKRTEVGTHFPSLLKDDDYPKPGEDLKFTKADYVSLKQDESAKLPDWHLRNFVDFRYFEFAEQFLDASTYFEHVNRSMNAMSRGNALVYKAIVDTFLAQIAGIYSYPRGHSLFRFFTDNDDYIPDEADSKNARQFYLKSGEIRKRLEEFRKYVKTYYKARVPYLTNLFTPEPQPNPPQGFRTIPLWSAMKADLSTKEKSLEYIRGSFMERVNNKWNTVARTHRRQSIISLGSAIFSTLDRMTTEDYRNWCGHEWGKDNKPNEGNPFRSKPSNLLVFVNKEDLGDMLDVYGSEITGLYAPDKPTGGQLRNWISKGVRFYGLDFLFPSMAIVMDKACFMLIQYFNKTYDEFHSFHLIDTKIKHTCLKLVLFRLMNCNVIELAKGQKFCPPLMWGSENLPYLAEA